MGLRTIKTNPGIGDACFIFQKLINSGEQFNWQIHNGSPMRGQQVFDLLPQLSASCTYVPDLQYKIVGPRNIQRQIPKWKDIRMQDFYLSANQWLEEGNRIETFLPDLPTSYELPFQTQEWTGSVAVDFPKGIYIGIYASAYSTVRSWGFWGPDLWMQLILSLHRLIPEAVFVQIGAQWDIDVADGILARMTAAGVPHINTIGKPLGYVIEMMKILNYGFYFPSGLGILSGLLHRKSVMFYPPALPKLACTWADPAIIEDGSFKECQFTTPENIFSWVKDEFKLETKI
jgi:hypothetical protein